MARAPFQVLVIPYKIAADGEPRYLLFKRSDRNVWQWIAGGGETGEQPEQAARREAFEEAGLPENTRLIRLDSMASIPAAHFADRHLWGADVYVIPEYSFGVAVENEEVCLSGEHQACVWLDYETAQTRLEWDSNKTALWELHHRLLPDAPDVH
jgi:dihydroneopterin triphosphate diphosphatase